MEKTVTVKFTPQAYHMLERLHQTGIYGKDVAEVVERIVCVKLHTLMEPNQRTK